VLENGNDEPDNYYKWNAPNCWWVEDGSKVNLVKLGLWESYQKRKKKKDLPLILEAPRPRQQQPHKERVFFRTTEEKIGYPSTPLIYKFTTLHVYLSSMFFFSYLRLRKKQ
jgi:hypothetical protein